MTYDWTQYLNIADRLAAKEQSALQRTAVSRAYYATFNLCRDWMEARGVVIPNRGAHKVLWTAFGAGTAVKAASAADAVAIGGYGRWLSSRRNRCDYEDDIEDLDRVVSDSLQRAHLVIDTLLPGLK